MMITGENEFRAEIESALCFSMESIRRCVLAGSLIRGELIQEKLWVMAARAYSEASDHIEGLGLTAWSGPLWMVQADVDGPMALKPIEEWLDYNQGSEDAAFVFPEMPPSGDFAYRMLFLTGSKETATLFKMLHT